MGTAFLPRGGGVVSGSAWLCALLDDVAQPAAMYAGVAGAWLRAGRVFDPQQDYARLPLERPPPG